MSLESLPVELYELIAVHCRNKQLSRLSRVNHAFHDLFNPILYKRNATVSDSPPVSRPIHYPYSTECPFCVYGPDAFSCLHWAVHRNSLSTLKLALAYGADINKIDEVTKYVQPYVDIELSCEGPLIDVPHATPLLLAILHERFEIVRWLLENGARSDIGSNRICKCRSDWRLYNKHLWLPLHHAIRHSSDDILQLMLSRDIVCSATCEIGDISGLRCAIEEGSLSTVEALIQHNSFDPNARYGHNQTPLHWVASCKNQGVAGAIVEKLVQAGVPLDEVAHYESGGTAFDLLVSEGKIEPALRILQLGANPTIDRANDGGALLNSCLDAEGIEESPSDQAERMREMRFQLLKLMIEKGVDLEITPDPVYPPDNDRRPLLLAFYVKDPRCVQVLLDAGAMAREAVSENGHDNFLRDFFALFMEEKGNPQLSIEWKEHLESFEESIRMVLDQGARIDSTDGQMSALSQACELERETGALTFLIENATRRNAELEYVAALRDRYVQDESIREMLDWFHHKMATEKTDEERIQDS
ncbi:hypothetical protein FBEOM_1257 [Fusarium beomiforme]|uniref:F-box domain-containing protein n=1 Tax=Fusarium beomiforme TaxID=44412 RepID=A0A9P5ATN1_9HYPO|nr:hypothetical protein FBEOM_1257 [Fusarium beomiforme]